MGSFRFAKPWGQRKPRASVENKLELLRRSGPDYATLSGILYQGPAVHTSVCVYVILSQALHSPESWRMCI